MTEAHYSFRSIELRKRYPLRISREIIHGTTSLFVEVTRDGLTGLGEMCPSKLTGAATAEEGRTQLEGLLATGIDDLSIHGVYARGRELGVAPCALAAIDMALWDLLGKRAGLPLYELLGLPRRAVPTSITIGINPPEVVRERVPEMLSRTGARALKIKLGSPDGLEADRSMFIACHEAAAPFGVKLRVDANGGWDVDAALDMMHWLAARGVDYVEQPLAEGREGDLPHLFAGRPLPLFVDESCRFSADVPKVAACVDGVNLKLTKCGGITEALRIVAAARAHGLGTMIGCNGETSVSIAAGASIGALFDHIDLDSHLNLDPDPATGAPIVDGVVLPTERPGHGASLSC